MCSYFCLSSVDSSPSLVFYNRNCSEFSWLMHNIITEGLAFPSMPACSLVIRNRSLWQCMARRNIKLWCWFSWLSCFHGYCVNIWKWPHIYKHQQGYQYVKLHTLWITINWMGKDMAHYSQTYDFKKPPAEFNNLNPVKWFLQPVNAWRLVFTTGQGRIQECHQLQYNENMLTYL